MNSRRLSGAALALALLHAGCDGSRVLDHTPAAPEPPTVAAGAAKAQAVPHAVFRATPGDVDGRIAGGNPLEVLFNMCQSRPADPGDELKFTYDFDADGRADQIGHCRARHTFTAAALVRVCVSDRRSDGAVCRTYAIELSDDPPPAPEHVLTLSLNSCQQGDGIRYQYLDAVVAPPLPAGLPYSVALTIDGDQEDSAFRDTLANLGEFECGGGWQPYSIDPTPLPNEHAVAMPPGSCPAGHFFVFGAIEGRTPAVPPRLLTTVVAFQVPGRRTRLEGQRTFVCP